MTKELKVVVVSAVDASGIFGGLERYVVQLKKAAYTCFGSRVSFVDVPFDECYLYEDGHYPGLAEQLSGADVIHANDFLAAWLCTVHAPTKPLVTAFHLLHQHFTYKSMGPHQTKIKAAEQIAIQKSTLLVANSKATAIDLISAGADPSKIEVVMNGVSSEFFEVSRPDRGSTLRLLFAGRLVEQKGADLLPNLMDSLSVSGIDWSLEIAGVGPWQNAIETHCAKYPSRCNFLGQIQSNQMRHIYARNDVTLSMTRYEPFGLFALESIAAGTPILGSVLGGMKEFCVSAHNALPVEDPHLVRGITQRLKDLWESKEILTSVPDLRRSVAALSWEQTVAGLDAAYVRAA